MPRASRLKAPERTDETSFQRVRRPRDFGSGPRATLQDVYSAGLSRDADGVTIG